MKDKVNYTKKNKEYIESLAKNPTTQEKILKDYKHHWSIKRLLRKYPKKELIKFIEELEP